MNRFDGLIAGCQSWSDFDAQAQRLTKKAKGDAFERLTQLYLLTHPEYQTLVDEVWLLDEVPAAIRKQLRLPGSDEGIDLIARARDGKFWAIQSKYRSASDVALTRAELSTFTSLAFVHCQGVALAITAHTSSRAVAKRRLMGHSVEIGLEHWVRLSPEEWQMMHARIESRAVSPAPRHPRKHQRDAIVAARQHFANNARGRLIMPCGTGKSLAAFWIANTLESSSILVTVPSLALISQSLKDWTAESIALGSRPEWLCVCSDDSVTDATERDDFVGEVADLGIPVVTDPDEIAKFLARPSAGRRIVFTTYQSGERVAEAARSIGFTFDLAIFDEAHKTVGPRTKRFAALLSEDNISIRKRMFMTATERVVRGRHDDVLTMDSIESYGECFFQLSFRDAIAQRLISDYRILTVAISDAEIRSIIQRNRLIDLEAHGLDITDADALAAGVALARVFEQYHITHALSFHSSIKGAQKFQGQQDVLSRLGVGPSVTNLHISSNDSAGERAELIREFVELGRALMTNARCLTEGVDIPSVDCVVFAKPRRSIVDIVQAAGRALRRFDGKEFGYILLPVIVPEGLTFEAFAETTAFKHVARTIAALSTQDERIAEEFRVVRSARRSSGRIVQIIGDVPVGMQLDIEEFAAAVSTRIWESVGRVNWRPFEEAREFARELNIANQYAWQTYCTSGDRPSDIPSAPDYVYRVSGWTSWGDWLGTGTVANRLLEYRPFNEARDFARGLKLKDVKEWQAFARSGTRPPGIPSSPNETYRDHGWLGWLDFLGTGAAAMVCRPFDEARDFARSLKLKNQKEWQAFAKSGARPPGVPSNPARVYKHSGWINWSDFLRTKNVGGPYRSFNEALAYVRSQKLNGVKEWRALCKAGNRPSDIPANPDKFYRDNGWTGWGDFLRTGNVSRGIRKATDTERATV